MLALTKKTDYALIALSYLAKRVEGVMSARELATASRVPLPILTNILKTLAHAGIVISERGSAGGYCLAKPAESISLHEMITAIEGPVHFVQCASTGPDAHRNPCDLESCCSIRQPAHRVHGRLKEFLETVTLAELVDDQTVSVGLHLVSPESVPLRQTPVREFAI
jgi:Rrf2 family protein